MRFTICLGILLFSFLRTSGQYTPDFEMDSTRSERNPVYGWFSMGSGIGGCISSKGILQMQYGVSLLFKEKHLARVEWRGFYGFGYEHRLRYFGAGIISYGYVHTWRESNSLVFSGGMSYGRGDYVGEDTAVYNSRFHQLLSTGEFIRTPYDCIGVNLSVKYLVRTRYYGFGMELYGHFHKRMDWGLVVTHNLGRVNRSDWKERRRKLKQAGLL